MKAIRINWDIRTYDIREYAENTAGDRACQEFFGMGSHDFLSLPSKEQDKLIDKGLQKRYAAARFLGLPVDIDIPDWLDNNDIKKWLVDEFGYSCKGFELCEHTKYTVQEKSALRDCVCGLLDEIASDNQTLDGFNDYVCDYITESIMVNNYLKIYPEQLDKKWILRELLDYIIKTS